jgi:hypothetical protein
LCHDFSPDRQLARFKLKLILTKAVAASETAKPYELATAGMQAARQLLEA